MLIRRDGLMAKPLPTGPDFEKLLSSKNASAAEYVAKQKQAMQAQSMPHLLNPAQPGQAQGQWPPVTQWHQMQMQMQNAQG